MNNYTIFGIGFLAQGLFSARLLVQWIYSEKAGKVLSPAIFWQLSITASFLLFVYGILRKDIVIIGGQTISYFIYLRNLYFQGSWRQIPGPFRVLAIAFPFIAIIWLNFEDEYSLTNILSNKDISIQLYIWGGIGQLIFIFRFVYQWYCSEKAQESILPLGFWIISIIGSLMVIIYGIFRLDPVLFIGQLFGSTVYCRNIIIHRKHKKQKVL